VQVVTTAWKRYPGAWNSSRRNDVRQPELFQGQEDRLLEEAAVGTDQSELDLRWKQDLEFRQERRRAAGAPGVSAPEPDVSDAAGLGQDGEEGMVRGATPFLRVVPLQDTFLGPVPFEDAGVKIQGVPGWRFGEPGEAPAEEGLEGLGHRPRREPLEEARERGGARVPPEAEELADRLVHLEDSELGEPVRAGEHPGEERQENLRRRGRVRRGHREREDRRELRGEADPLREGDEEREAAPR
jgi:hypothetical protein